MMQGIERGREARGARQTKLFSISKSVVECMLSRYFLEPEALQQGVGGETGETDESSSCDVGCF